MSERIFCFYFLGVLLWCHGCAYSIGKHGNETGLCIESSIKPCLEIPGLLNSTICGGGLHTSGIVKKLEAAAKMTISSERMEMDIRPFIYKYGIIDYLGFNLTFTKLQSRKIYFCFRKFDNKSDLPFLCREVTIGPKVDLSKIVFFWDCAIDGSGHFQMTYSSPGSGKGQVVFSSPSRENINLSSGGSGKLEALWLLRQDQIDKEEYFVVDLYPLPIPGTTEYSANLIQTDSDNCKEAGNQAVVESQVLSYTSTCDNSTMPCYVKEPPVRLYFRKPEPGKYMITVTPVTDMCESSCVTSCSPVLDIQKEPPYVWIGVGVTLLCLLIIVAVLVIPKYIRNLIQKAEEKEVLILYENSHPEVCDFMKLLANLLKKRYHFKPLVPDWENLEKGTTQWVADNLGTAERVLFCGPGTRYKYMSNVTTEKVSNTYSLGLGMLKGNDAKDRRAKCIQVMFKFSRSSDRNLVIGNQVCLMNGFEDLIELLERSRHTKLQAFLISRCHRLTKEEKGQLENALVKVKEAEPWEREVPAPERLAIPVTKSIDDYSSCLGSVSHYSEDESDLDEEIVGIHRLNLLGK